MFMLFNIHESIYNLPLDLPHPCDSSARCREVKWSKCCLLGFDTFLGILEQPEVLGHQQSACRKDPAIRLIFQHIFSWALSFRNSTSQTCVWDVLEAVAATYFLFSYPLKLTLKHLLVYKKRFVSGPRTCDRDTEEGESGSYKTNQTKE